MKNDRAKYKDIRNSSLNTLPLDYQFNGLDVMKFVCAILVVMIHIAPIPDFSDKKTVSDYLNFFIQHCICRVAVPFYFTTSGFLLFRRMNLFPPNNALIKTYCFRILRIFGTWMFLLFIGGNEHLWYLGALVLAVFILSRLLAIKKIRIRYLICITLILNFIGLLGTSYYGLINNIPIIKSLMDGYLSVFSTTRNGVFFGLVYVLMGVLFAHKSIIIDFKLALIGLLASFICMSAEVFLLWKYTDPKDYCMLVSLLPVTFFLFYIFTHINLSIPNNQKMFIKMRIIGVLVFYSHMLVNYIVISILNVLCESIRMQIMPYRFFIVTIISLTFAALVLYLSKRKNFTALKYLYS